jgi:hypothetical protein
MVARDQRQVSEFYVFLDAFSAYLDKGFDSELTLLFPDYLQTGDPVVLSQDAPANKAKCC